MKHLLKTLPKYWYRVDEGQKNFEVRKNDRDFQVGDICYLVYYNPDDEKDLKPTDIAIIIKYVLTGGQYGIADDYCVFGFQKL